MIGKTHKRNLVNHLDVGYLGFIHNVLRDEYLADHPAPEDCEYYLWSPNHEYICYHHA